MGREIYVVTGYGKGHLHPAMDLCNLLSSRNYHTTLVIPSTLSSIPPSFLNNPLSTVAQIAPLTRPPLPPPGPDWDPLSEPAARDLAAHIRKSTPPLCAIVDFQVAWTKRVFWEHDVPVIGLFTFGACAAAMEWGAWKVCAGEITSPPIETRLIPGLPPEMAITYWDLKRKAFGISGKRGPPGPGDRPPWISAVEGSAGLLFNTCDDLDGVFLKYVEEEMGLPTWAVGPLLPDNYWQPNPTENNQLIKWLDRKPRGSVLYVAFGSEVGPTVEEHAQLASALAESTHPFIWVVRDAEGYNNYTSSGLGERVGERGLIIHGWAPQVLILSHVSTGGFLSHCGWNSTMEGIGRGVPFLAWPIRGDQFYNAKLVVNYLKIGYKVAEDMSGMVMKEDIVKGIESIMGDEEMRRRSWELKGKFDGGFPSTSAAALDVFCEFVNHKPSTALLHDKMVVSNLR